MQDFKTLQVWQKSHDLTLRMYELTSLLRRLKTVNWLLLLTGNWLLVTDYLCGISRNVNSIII